MAEERKFSLIDVFDDLGNQNSSVPWSVDAVGTLVRNNVPGPVADDTECTHVQSPNLRKKVQKIEQKLLNKIRSGEDYDVFILENKQWKRLKRDTKIEGLYIPASRLIINEKWVKCEIREESLPSKTKQNVGRPPKWDWLEIHIEIQKRLYLKETRYWTVRSIAKDVCEFMKGKHKVTKAYPKDDQSTPDLDDVRKAVSAFIHLYQDVYSQKVIDDPP